MKRIDYNIENDLIPEDNEEITSRDIRLLINVGVIMVVIPLSSVARFFGAQYSTILIGLTFLGLGLLSYTDKSKKYIDKRFGSIVSMSLGGLIILIPLMLAGIRFSGLFSGKTEQQAEMFVVGTILFMLSVVVTVLPFVANRMQKERCSYPVTATCIGLKGRSIRRSDTMLFIPIWEFDVNGENVKIEGMPQGYKMLTKKGDTRDFLVNPNDPEEIYYNNDITRLLCVIIGLCIAAAGVPLILYVFH